jgi:hypothetical protein
MLLFAPSPSKSRATLLHTRDFLTIYKSITYGTIRFPSTDPVQAILRVAMLQKQQCGPIIW